MKLVPFHDYVIVKRDEIEETKSPGGIIVPKHAQKEIPVECTVVAMGDDVVKATALISEGSRVVVGKWAGQKLTIDEEDFLVVRFEDVIGVIKD